MVGHEITGDPQLVMSAFLLVDRYASYASSSSGFLEARVGEDFM